MLISRSNSNLPDALPFFTNWNAAQMMATQVEYIDFQNGSGVRYLTRYGQGSLSNQQQGHVLHLPGHHQRQPVADLGCAAGVGAGNCLQGAESMPQDQSFFDNFASYVSNTEALLDSQPRTSASTPA